MHATIFSEKLSRCNGCVRKIKSMFQPFILNTLKKQFIFNNKKKKRIQITFIIIIFSHVQFYVVFGRKLMQKQLYF